MNLKTLLLLAIAFFAGRSAFADGFIVINHPSGLSPSPYSFAPLEVTFHHVNAAIDGQI